MLFNNSTYNILKKLVQIVIPAVSSLYFGLSQIWGLPWGEEIVGTLALLATFLGVLLGISTNKYNNSPDAYDGEVVISDSPTGTKLFSLELNGDPEQIETMDQVRFKVSQK